MRQTTQAIYEQAILDPIEHRTHALLTEINASRPEHYVSITPGTF